MPKASLPWTRPSDAIPSGLSTLMAAAVVADQFRHRQDSIGYLRRAVALEPRRSNPHAALALQLANEKQWDEAAEECKLALKFNPTNNSARMTLVRCYARNGQPERARAEFATLLDLNPGNRVDLTRWFDSVR